MLVPGLTSFSFMVIVATFYLRVVFRRRQVDSSREPPDRVQHVARAGPSPAPVPAPVPAVLTGAGLLPPGSQIHFSLAALRPVWGSLADDSG